MIRKGEQLTPLGRPWHQTAGAAASDKKGNVTWGKQSTLSTLTITSGAVVATSLNNECSFQPLHARVDAVSAVLV